MAQLPQVKGWDRYSRGSPYKKMPNRAGEHLKGLPDYSTRYLPQAASGGLMSAFQTGGDVTAQRTKQLKEWDPNAEPDLAATSPPSSDESGVPVTTNYKMHNPNNLSEKQRDYIPFQDNRRAAIADDTEEITLEPQKPPVDPLKNLKTLEAHLYGDGIGRRGAAEEQTGFDMEKAMPWFAMAARLQTPGQSTGEAVTAAISDYTSLTNAAREAARDDRKEEADALTARAHALYYYATAIDEMSPSGTGPNLNQHMAAYKAQMGMVEFEISQIQKNLDAARGETDQTWANDLNRQLNEKYRERALIKMTWGITRRQFGLSDIDYRPSGSLFAQPQYDLSETE
jgi:hypothetical protein